MRIVNRIEIQRLIVKGEIVEYSSKVPGTILVCNVERVKPFWSEVVVFVFLFDVLIALVLAWESFVVQPDKATIAKRRGTPDGMVMKMNCLSMAPQVGRARKCQVAVLIGACGSTLGKHSNIGTGAQAQVRIKKKPPTGPQSHPEPQKRAQED